MGVVLIVLILVVLVAIKAYVIIGLLVLGIIGIAIARAQGPAIGPTVATPWTKRPSVAWYDVPSARTSVQTYLTAALADTDADNAVRHGWMVQSIATNDGHVNVGRTVTGAVLTGGISLLLGGSRTQGKLTVVYARTPEWLAEQRQAGNAPMRPPESLVCPHCGASFSAGQVFCGTCGKALAADPVPPASLGDLVGLLEAPHGPTTLH